MTQHPQMMKCVVSHVGIYDMLRVELSPNGAFNVPEFGTVLVKNLFEVLFRYSPYHRVAAPGALDGAYIGMRPYFVKGLPGDVRCRRQA